MYIKKEDKKRKIINTTRNIIREIIIVYCNNVTKMVFLIS